MHRTLKAAIVTAVAAAGITTGVSTSSPAKASTPGCNQDGFCSSYQFDHLAAPLDMAVTDTAHAGSPVTIKTPGQTNGETDWIATGVPGGRKTFQWAPGDIGSGLCLSADSSQPYKRIRLENCNGWSRQYFDPIQDPITGAFMWRTDRKGAGQLVITDPNNGGEFTRLTLAPLKTADRQFLDWSQS